MAIKVRAAVSGLREWHAAVKLMNTETRQRVIEAIRTTTGAVRDGAAGRVAVRSGELRDTIRDEYTEEGLTGFVKVGFGKLQRRSRATTQNGKSRAAALRARRKKTSQLGVYGMVIEYGSPGRKLAAQPYLRPALRAEKEPHFGRMQRALRGAAGRTNQGGGT